MTEKEKTIADCNYKSQEKDKQIMAMKDAAAMQSASYEQLANERLNLETELESLNDRYNKIKEKTFFETIVGAKLWRLEAIEKKKIKFRQ